MRSPHRIWQELSPTTQLLCKLALLNLIFINLVLVIVFATPIGETVLNKFRLFLMLSPGGSRTWEVMSSAYDYIQSNAQNPVYSEIFFNQGVKLQYPPTALLSLTLFRTEVVSSIFNRIGLDLFHLLNGLSWVAIAATAYFTSRIFSLSRLRYGGDRASVPRHEAIISTILLFSLALNFYPVIQAYTVKQIHAWMTCLLAIAFWLLLKNQIRGAGMLIGVLCLVEPQYLFIVFWGMFRRRWAFVAAIGTTAVIGLIISISIFGLANHTNFLEVIAYVARHGEGFYPNQSVNGLLNRLLFNGNNLVWQDSSFPPFHPIVYGLTAISSAILLGLGIWKSRKVGEGELLVDFSSIILACTMACPVVWEHCYGLLLPIYAYLFPFLLSQKDANRSLLPWIFVSYVLSSNYFLFTNQIAEVPVLNITQSYLLIGALIMFAILQTLKASKFFQSTNTLREDDFKSTDGFQASA